MKWCFYVAYTCSTHKFVLLAQFTARFRTAYVVVLVYAKMFMFSNLVQIISMIIFTIMIIADRGPNEHLLM